jgi:TP901 family phage tail tape measure protein
MPNLQIQITASTREAEREIRRFLRTIQKTFETVEKSKIIAFDKSVVKQAEALSKSVKRIEKDVKQVVTNTKELAAATEKGFTKIRTEIEKARESFVNLRWGIRDVLKDAMTLMNFQLRWYLGRSIVFGSARALREGIEFEAEIDKAEALLLRYAAMEENVRGIHRHTAEELVKYSRQIAINLPIAFEEVIKASDRLLAAGINIETVKASLEDFAKLQVAFPEIDPEKFTTAIVGFLNTFRHTPGLREFENDAERFRAILDKITKALAVGVIAPKDINLVIQHLGQMAQAAGFTIDQMLALSVIITNLGAKAGPAARALRGLIDSLSTPKGIKELEKIGIVLDKSKTIAEQFEAIINGLRKALGSGELGMTLEAMSFLRGIAPVQRRSALIALIRELETYHTILNAIQNSQGALARTSEVMTDTLSGQWQIFKNLTKELRAAFSNSQLLKDGLKLLIGAFKVLGFVLSGVAGLLSLTVDGFKWLYHTVRLITNPLERVIASLMYLVTGNFKKAWEEIKRMPKVAIHHFEKASEALAGSLDRAAKEVITIQDVLFNRLKFSGGKDRKTEEILKGLGIPKEAVENTKEYRRVLDAISNIMAQISTISVSEAWRDVQVEIQKSFALLDSQLKMGRISLEDYYKQRSYLREKSLAEEATKIQKEFAIQREVLRKQIEELKKGMDILKEDEAKIREQEIRRLTQKMLLLEVKEFAQISELIRKNELAGYKDSLQYAYQKFKAEKSYKKQLMKLTHDAVSMELIGIQKTSEKAKKKYETLIPLIERLSEAQKQAWLMAVEISTLKTYKKIAEKQFDRRTALAYQIEIYKKELEKLARYIKQREEDLRLSKITGEDVELIKKDLERLKALYTSLMLDMEKAQKTLSGSMFEGIKDGLREFANRIKTTYEFWHDISLETYKNIAEGFSDLFYDTITGKLKDLGDYFDRVWKNILRMFANYLAQMAVLASNPITVPILVTIGNIMGMSTPPAPMSMGMGGGIPGVSMSWAGGFKPVSYAGASYFGLPVVTYPTPATAVGALEAYYGTATPSLGAGAIFPFLGAGLLGYGLGQLFGGKYSGIGGALGSMLGMGIGYAVAGGGSIAAGMAAGSWAGPIGMLIGSAIGGFLGSLFGSKKVPAFAAGLYPTTEPGKHWSILTEPYGGVGYLGVKYKTFMGEEARRAAEQLLKVFENVMDSVVDTFNVSTDKLRELVESGEEIYFEVKKGMKWEEILQEFGKGLANIVESLTGIDFTQFQKSGENLTQTILRIIQAVKDYPKVLESFDDYIAAIQNQYDEIARWKDQMVEAQKQIEDLRESLQNATDPSDAINYANQLKQAIYEKYMAEKQMIEGLVASIRQAEMDLMDFRFNLEQKIAEMTGVGDVAGIIMEKFRYILEQMAADIGNIFAERTVQQIKNVTSIKTQNVIKLVGEIFIGLWQPLIERTKTFEKAIQMTGDVIAINATQIQNSIVTMDMSLDQMMNAISNAINTLLQSGGMTVAQIDKLLGWVNAAIGAIDQWVSTRISDIQRRYARLEEAERRRVERQQEAIRRQTEALQQQLKLVQEWKNLLERVDATIRSLVVGTANPRDVFERLAYARERVMGVYSMYLGATGEQRLEYAGKLHTLIQEYLKIAQEAFQRPSTQYQTIYEQMINMLELIKEDASANAAKEEELQEQIKKLQQEANVLSRQQVSYSAQMNAEIQKVKQQAAEYYKWIKEIGTQLHLAKIEELKNRLSELLGDKTVEQYLADLQLAAVTELAQIRKLLESVWSNILGKEIQTFATGGYVTRPTLALIGEREPEYIIPASKMRAYTQNITVSPQITIVADRGADLQAIRREVEDAIVYSIKYGKARQALKEAVAYG